MRSGCSRSSTSAAISPAIASSPNSNGWWRPSSPWILSYSAGDIAGAISLLEQGVRANPTRWEIAQDLARTYYLDLKDYRQTLHWFEVTDRLPGRPHYVARFIARLYAATGERETALELWRAMHDSATSDWVRDISEQEIAKLVRASPPSPSAVVRETP